MQPSAAPSPPPDSALSGPGESGAGEPHRWEKFGTKYFTPQRSRPAQKPQPENTPYRNFVDPRCLRPSLSCKRPLRAVAGGSSLSRPPGRGLQSSSSPSSTITDERFAQPLPLPELEHAPSESLSLQRSILPPARSTTGRLRHPSIYQLQSAVVGRPYLPQ
ncbi:hypothetical protein ACCO45_002781 [Purpureocillium lilacinum]|uniref:Uncharacterized protein n=1 Tax=Purpureocillium lilacinum TaxID=33203 RepID=A0ACC4DYU4_PURLI